MRLTSMSCLILASYSMDEYPRCHHIYCVRLWQEKSVVACLFEMTLRSEGRDGWKDENESKREKKKVSRF